MNRSEGLVQRRNVQSSNTQSNRYEEDDDNKQNTGEEEEFDHDSKETRLTLMEEVLLLGLKDREVRSLREDHKLRFKFI